MATTSAAAPASPWRTGDRRGPSPLDAVGSLPRGVRATGALGVVALLTLAVQWPVLGSEPVFVSVNTAVVVSMVALGGYLVVCDDERFTGLCLMSAAGGWLVTNLDIYPRWGTALSWLIGGGLVYTPIGWGVLRYGTARLDRRERLFISACLGSTVGMCALLMLFSRPEWLAYSPDAAWLSIWPDETVAAVINVAACLSYLALGGFFAWVAFRKLHDTPPVRRRIMRPLILAGAGWSAVAAVVTTVGSLVPETVSIHANSNIVGVLSLGVTGALGVAINRRRMLGSAFLAALPATRTPESLVAYVRSALSDTSADLLFVVPERDILIDGTGRPRSPLSAGGGDRFHQPILGSDGREVAVLTGDSLLSNDPATLESFAKVLSIVAENEQLHAVLRMRLVQLTAARAAERMAFDRAREQFRRDLHDGVQQTIAAARMDLDGASEEGGGAITAEVDRKLAVALEQIRNLKRGGDPPELRPGIGPAVQRIVAELRLDATCRIVEPDLGALTLPAYYILREALTNIHKHARGARAEITLGRCGELIELAVRDTGPGGVVVRAGGGLAGLRDRVTELGGSFSIVSPPGAGTTLRALIPPVPA